MSQQKDTKGTVFIVVSALLIAAVAGIIVLTIVQQNTSNSLAGKEYACTLQFARDTSNWQDCMNR